MARFSIYSKDGESIRHSGKPVYNGTYLKVPYVEFKEIASPFPIDWEIGDYLDYSRTGLRYKLYSIPQPKKQGRQDEYGASFVYSNVQLFDATKELEIALFNDMVLDAERNVHFSTRESTSTFEDVYGIARRCQASIDAFFPGKWVIQVMELDPVEDADLIAILSEPKEFEASSGSVLGALNAIYNTWEGIGWIHTYDSQLEKDVITIGRPNKRDAESTTPMFVYGEGYGLTAIKKSYTNVDEFATRLYVYGSERNLPNRWYNNLDICNAASVDIANLMLPLTRWGRAVDPVSGETRPDASLCYIEDPVKVAKYGLIPRKVYFDGSQNEEIYPSIKNMTVGRLRTAKSESGDSSYVPKPLVYTDAAERLDVVKACNNPSDSGIISELDSDDPYVFTTNVTPSTFTHSGYLRNASVYAEQRGPYEVTINDYSPSRGGTSVEINKDYSCYLTIDDDVDPFTLTQKTTIYYKKGDGTSASKLFSEKISPYRNASHEYEFDLPNVEYTVEGTITRVVTVLSLDREYNHSADMAFTMGCLFPARNDFFYGFKEEVMATFTMYLKQIGFNLADCVSTIGDGLATISMKDGMCGGRNFVVKRCTYRQTQDDWELVVKRFEDTSVNMAYPNASFPINAGDAFVILDIEMPDLYVNVGMETLLEKALPLYDDVSTGKAYYEPEIDAEKVLTSGIVLKEGMYMMVHDEDIIEGNTDYILIDSLTIDESASNIPTYKVTLREKKHSGYAQTIATSLSNLAHQIEMGGKGNGVDIIMSMDSRPAADDNVLSALRSQLDFLSKKYDDVAQGLITLLQGANFGNFAEGITGFGARIDGDGHGELSSLTLRQWLEVPEFRYNRVLIQIGNSWRAPGGGIIERVEPDYDANGNMLNTGVIYLHLEDGEPGMIALDDICMGIFHDGIDDDTNADADADDGIGNFKFEGFYTTYFRVTEVLAGDNHAFRYAIRPVSTNWPETHHPSEGMHFVAYGNFTDTTRQTARYSTRTYERYLKDVNTWEFTANNIGAQFGDLSNLSVFGLNMTGYSAYLNNIYMSGVIEQFEQLPYRIDIDTEGQDTLAYGEHLNVSCTVYKGWEDMTDHVVGWSIVRDTGDPLADAAWNVSQKAQNFDGDIVIEHGQNYSDLGSIGVSTLFTITAIISDGTTTNYTLEL